MALFHVCSIFTVLVLQAFSKTLGETLYPFLPGDLTVLCTCNSHTHWLGLIPGISSMGRGIPMAIICSTALLGPQVRLKGLQFPSRSRQPLLAMAQSRWHVSVTWGRRNWPGMTTIKDGTARCSQLFHGLPQHPPCVPAPGTACAPHNPSGCWRPRQRRHAVPQPLALSSLDHPALVPTAMTRGPFSLELQCLNLLYLRLLNSLLQ